MKSKLKPDWEMGLETEIGSLIAGNKIPGSLAHTRQGNQTLISEKARFLNAF